MPSIASRKKVLRGAERSRTVVFCFVSFLVAVSSGVLLAADPAHAAAFRVNSMGDAADNSSTDGECATDPFPVGTEPNCTLRAAIGEANFNGQGDTIVFDPALSGTITLTLGQLRIEDDTAATDDLSIQGPGAGKITVSGNDASRVFMIPQDATAVTIAGLTVTGGSIPTLGGGGIDNDGTLELLNTTVSGNTSGSVTTNNSSGGGIDNGGTLRLTNSTVSGNTASGSGGGIWTAGPGAAIRNTIVAGNAAAKVPDASGPLTSRGNNLVGDTSGATGFVGSDLVNVEPLLGPLQDNGGPTHTHALLPGSPAVDAASNAPCLVTDQRGVLRKDGDKDGTVTCDMGAFERNDLAPPRVTSTTPPAGKTGVRRNTDLTAIFPEKMDAATITRSTFKLFRVTSSGTTQVTNVTVTLSSNGLKATLNPFGTSSTLLARNTRYKAVVTTGAEDLAGNALDQNTTKAGNQQKTWTFVTKR